MKNLKRLSSALIAIVMLVLLASCGNAEPAKEFSRGTVSDNVYHSDFAELTFAPGGDWVFATDDEIAQMMNIGAELMKDPEAMKKAMENIGSVTDMQAASAEMGTNVIITYENLKKAGRSGMSSKNYVEAVKAQIAANASSELNYKFSDIQTVTLTGEEFSSFISTAVYGDVKIYQKFYARTIGDYAASIAVTVQSPDQFAAVEALFSTATAK